VRDVAKLRSSGARATKPPGIDIKTLRGDWTKESAYQSVRSWLALSTSRQLNIGRIVSQNDAMAMGARRAFLELTDPREREAWMRLPLTGCDGVAKAGLAWVREGILTATVICPPLMGPALILMANAIRSGAQPDERTVIPPTSYPTIEELQTKARAHAAGKPK
jgi:ABC-type sugar transport system substrate-binding protein